MLYTISAVGQDSHRFEETSGSDEYMKHLVIGGVMIPDVEGFEANSDGDVVLHSLVNAISGISCENILGEITDDMCFEQGITDSKKYVERALETLGDSRIVHVSFSVECKRPVLSPYIQQIRESIGQLLDIAPDHVGFTVTSGEGLTDFGRGLGVQSLCCVTVKR